MGESSTAPIEEGEQYTIEIEDIGEEGDGIAHIRDFVLIVPEGDMGDRVTVRVDSVQDDFAAASVVEDETAGGIE